MRKSLAFALVILAATTLSAQEGEKPGLGFQAGINLGTDVLPTGPLDLDGNPTNEGWTRLGFQPDLSFGKFGVGLDLTFRIQLYPEQDEAIRLYEGDWVPSGDRNILDVYLPKILYLRYGLKGEDPFFVKLGSIDDLTLGNGFIMGGYSNMSFYPATRLFGLDLGLDGALFDFPFVGAELLTGNLARLDVVGGRVFVRPLLGTGIPIIKNMQVGATAVVDTDPYLYDSTPGGLSSVAVYGADVMVPILGGKAFPLAAFAELAFEPEGRSGAMLGLGGRVIGIFTYGAQLRYLGAGFIPSYFDANYDLYRAAKADVVATAATGDSFIGWFASLGTSLLEDRIVFNASVDGPFAAAAPGATDQAAFPHAKAVFVFGEGLIGGIFFDASYEKYYLGKDNGFLEDLVDPTNAVIGLSVNYQTGASVLTLRYDARYDPDTDDFKVSSSIQASLKL